MSRHNGSAARPAPSGPRDVRTVVLVGPSGAGKSTLFHAVLGAEPESERRARGKESGPEASTALDVGTVEVPRGGPPGVEPEWARDDGTGEGEGDRAVRVTVLDTPGRPDFVGEVRAGLRAADGVVFVVSAVDGIDSASRMLWRECAALGKPRAVAVTQLESTRADYAGVVEEVRRSFGDARPLLVPILEDGQLVGLADLLSRKVEGTGEWEDWAEELRGPVLESLIEESEDETLLDRYLEGEEISAEQLAGDLEVAVCSGRFFPIVPVHPPTGAGVAQLLALVVRAFPSAADVPLPAVTSPEGEPLELPGADPAGPLVAEVVRTTTDPYVGRLSLVRVFCGTLRSDDKLHVSGHLGRAGHPDHDDDDERVGQLLEPRPDGQAARDSAVAGEVVLVTKLAHAETSDTLSSMDGPALVEPWVLPEPLLPVAVHAVAAGEEDKLAPALQRLVSEDVTVRLEQNPDTHQVVLWTLGTAHVEDLLARLRDRHHVEVELEEVRTSLRETFVQKVTAQGRLVKQSGGHGQYAVVQLQIEPLDRGAGIEFVDEVVGGAVPRQYIPAVEKGVRQQLAEGVLAGYPAVDVRVRLVDGKAHSVDSSDMAFQTAGAMALREAANDATVSLLEPIDRIEVTVADDAVGAVMADLRGRRAQVHGTQAAELEGHTVVVAEVPAHELSRYPIDLRSVSHGTGSFTREFVRYDFMPPQLAHQLMASG